MGRGPLIGILPLLPRRRHLVQTFEIAHSRHFLFIPTNDFGSVFQNLLDRRIYETSILATCLLFFFPFFISLISLTFFDAQKPFVGECSHVIILSVFC